MKDLLLAFEVLDKVYENVKQISDEKCFFAFVCTMIDQWAADHNMTSDDVIEMTKHILEAQEGVHNTLGMPEKTF